MFKTKLIEEFSKYKHISFDLWLTLIRTNPAFKPKRNRLFKDFFEIEKPMEEVAAIIRKFDILTNGINEKVTKNFDTYEIYCLILDALGVEFDSYSHQQLEEFYKLTEALMLEYKPLLLDDNLPSFLKQLHNAGKTMNILSNTAFIKGHSLRHVIRHYELDSYFNFQAYSDETGFSKPGLAMYEYAYQNIQKIVPVAKHEVIHVGDNIVSDYNGALAFGFEAHLLINKTTDESKL
ncbi:HAD family hydrolase [Pedobacter helvus]|uniref:HAD family hydrolase n=1 Tax=Pedobacter helvus TaxID=2563444 RepID=A0ABW9JGT4_9SPHI|nr:HAD family hydrolase [Pedobacter ureilyticus]